ncbi:hypothetical protein SteCoe_21610 [Stentor coeruleus]|uniref:ODAD1 central coiled coil region domain-containing protein n=1 Tax=Stentor coeruleus TaxID=5963 RepID=A0A1R2BP42_9CILI|nr:hypothetical protein SteCoe_21610 [Stentor coeruleus]
MNKFNTFSKCTINLREPESIRLQKDLESITKSLEHEKRESMYLDEQFKVLQFEMNSLAKPFPTSFTSLRSTISVLEKKLELEINTLNQTKYKNRQLRQQINEYRLDKSAHKQSLNAVIENLEKTSKAANEQYDELLRKNDENISQKEKIGMLRTKSANQRFKYDEKISTLSSVLKNSKFDTKFLYEETQYSTQSTEVLSVLKRLIKFSNRLTINKKHEIDQYIKHVTLLDNYFNEIKIVTGMNEIKDIVTSCLKSEEQSQQVLSYLNNLNSDIDLLEEKLKISDSKIQFLEGLKYQGRLSIQEAIKTNETNLALMQDRIKDKKEVEFNRNIIIQNSLPLMKKIYKLLENMHFKDYFGGFLDVEAIDKLNQEYSAQLLGKIEEYLSFLLLAIELRKQSILTKHRSPSAPNKKDIKKKKAMKNFLEEKYLYDGEDFDEIRVPISVQEMKKKAAVIFERRRSMLKAKPTTPDISHPKTPTYRLTRELL